MDNILILINALKDKKEQIAQSELYLKDLKAEKDLLQAEVINELKTAGLKSIKTSDALYALTVKQDIRVLDTEAVFTYLKKAKLLKTYTRQTLDTTGFKAYARNMLKQTGEVADGCEPFTTEFVSVKNL